MADPFGPAYELEPWEQARRQRLETYAQLRDKVAGIVVNDGNGKPHHQTNPLRARPATSTLSKNSAS